MIALLILLAGAIVLTLRTALVDGPSAAPAGADASHSNEFPRDAASNVRRDRDAPVAPASEAPAGPRGAPGRERARPPRSDKTSPASHNADATPAASDAHAPTAAETSPDATRWGRFTVLGAEGATPNRVLGSSVAIDGDVAVATVWFHEGTIWRGGVEIYERRAGRWTNTQRLEPPEYADGAPSHVGVAGGRIVAVGGRALGTRDFVFRSYLRGADGTWALEAETPLGQGAFGSDWAFRGDTLVAVPNNNSRLAVWRVAAGTWTPGELTRPSGARLLPSTRSWVTLDGDVAVGFSGGQAEEDIAFFRRGSGVFKAETSIHVEAPGTWGTSGALCRGGDALVTAGVNHRLTIYEHTATGWTQRSLAKPRIAVASDERHAVAADGDLAVIATIDPESIVVFKHRADDWRWTAVPAPATPAKVAAKWLTRGASIALSGRTVIVGARWAEGAGDRVVFFDVTDDDLARAAPVETLTRRTAPALSAQRRDEARRGSAARASSRCRRGADAPARRRDSAA